MKRMPRWLAGIALTALLAGCGGATGGSTPAPSAPAAPQGQAATPPAPKTPDKVTLLLQWVPSANQIGFFLAKDRGYYKDAGIDVNIVDGKGSAVTVQAIGSGSGGDIGFASLDLMALARAKGIPLQAVMGMIQANPFGVFVDKDSPINKPADLVGHTLLVTAGSPEVFYLPAVAKKQGFDVNGIKEINVGAANKVPDYMAKKADAMATDVANADPFIEPKRPSKMIDFADNGLIAPSFGLFARTDYIKTHEDLIRRFIAATNKGWQAVMNDPKAAAEGTDDMIKAHPGQGLQAQPFNDGWKIYGEKFMWTPNTKGHPFGWQSADDWKATLEMLHDYAGLDGSMNPTEYFTNEYLPK